MRIKPTTWSTPCHTVTTVTTGYHDRPRRPQRQQLRNDAEHIPLVMGTIRTIYWDVMPLPQVTNGHYKENYCRLLLNLPTTCFTLFSMEPCFGARKRSEDRGGTLLRNVGELTPDCKISHPRIRYSS
jgi:hypothetical protein